MSNMANIKNKGERSVPARAVLKSMTPNYKHYVIIIECPHLNSQFVSDNSKLARGSISKRPKTYDNTSFRGTELVTVSFLLLPNTPQTHGRYPFWAACRLNLAFYTISRPVGYT